MTPDHNAWVEEMGVPATEAQSTRVGYAPAEDRVVVEVTMAGGGRLAVFALTRREAEAMASDIVDVLEAAADPGDPDLVVFLPLPPNATPEDVERIRQEVREGRWTDG
jgi:hypothetical protein